MKFRLVDILKYLAFLLIGILFLYLAFRNQNLSEITVELKKTKSSTFLLVFCITFLGNIIRTLRWRLLLSSVGYTPSYLNTFLSLMFGYFVNFGVPRLGEITRCYSLKRSEGVPFNYSIGTVITERIVDILCLLFFCIFTFILQYNLLSGFFVSHMILPVTKLINEKISHGLWVMLGIGITGIILLVILYFMRKRLFKIKVFIALQAFLKSVWMGASSVFKLNYKMHFFLYTLCIWMCYFLSTYLWFGGYEKTAHLGLHAGMTLLVVGSLGRSIPIQGHGMGAYHFLITTALTFYGISEFYGNILATVIYLTQTAFYLGVGAICTLTIVLIQKKKTSPIPAVA